MFCPICGNQLKEGAKFCSKCGFKMEEASQGSASPVKQERTAAKQERTAAKQESAATKQSKPPKAKSKKLLVITIVMAVVTVLAAIAGVLAIRHLNQKNDTVLLESVRSEYGSDEETTEETTEETEAVKEETSTATATETLPTVQATELSLEVPTSLAAAAQTISCSVMYANQFSFSGLVRANVLKETVTQTSHVSQPNSSIDNTGWSAFDGQSVTSWQEGSQGDGIGDAISAGFDREYQVKAIRFLLGNHRSDSWFVKNNMPKTLIINLGEKVFQADFPQEKTEFVLVFSDPVPAADITVTIDQVFKGTEYEDTPISEVEIYGN